MLELSIADAQNGNDYLPLGGGGSGCFDRALLRHVGCGDARDHRRRMGLSPPADYEARIAEIVDAYCERALVAFADIHQSLDGIDLSTCVVPSYDN